MFTAWIDARNGSGASVYLQRSNILNPKLFADTGVLVTFSSNSKGNLSMISDGSGGVIVVWQENNDLYAKRFNSSGTPVWNADKLLTVNTAGTQSGPVMTVVNSTQAMVAYVEGKNNFTGGTGNDIYVQKIDLATGNTLLAIDTPVCRAPLNQTAIQITADGTGGAFICWQDPRVATTNTSIYAARVNNDGLLASGWNTDGNAICTEAGNQNSPVMVSDNNGGAYITWLDFRQSASNGDIYAQRLTASGSVVWATNGVPVNRNIGSQTLPQILAVNDGAILCWTDPRLSTSNRDIYAQKISLNTGDTLWAPSGGGVLICDAPDQQTPSTSDGLKMITDGSNGAIIIWVDQRNNTANNYDLYAQKVNSSGVVQWASNGVVVSNNSGRQGSVIGGEYIAGTNGAMVVWQDGRSGTTSGEIYGALISGDGNLTSLVRDRQPLEGKIKLFPIPATTQLQIALSDVKPGAYLIQVIDVNGRILSQQRNQFNGTTGLLQTKVEQLQRGMYYLRLVHESSKTESLFNFQKL